MGAGEGIPQGQAEIFVYDTVAMDLTRITNAAGSGIRASEAPSVNADGTKIAFMSDADFLGQGIPVLQKEIWLYSLAKGQVYLPIVLKQSP